MGTAPIIPPGLPAASSVRGLVLCFGELGEHGFQVCQRLDGFFHCAVFNVAAQREGHLCIHRAGSEDLHDVAPVLDGTLAAMVRVAHESDRLVLPLGRDVVDGVLERPRHGTVVLGGDKDESFAVVNSCAERLYSSVVVFLVWGDPAFYDSTIRIVERIREFTDVEPHVVPGITAFQALAAAHGIVLHEVGGPVHITTGRRLVDEWQPGLGMTVVMLDGHLKVQHLVDKAADATIWWAANLGLESQQLRSGRLADVIDDIIATRARIREDHGWVMDVYAFTLAE